ncbi:MAG: DUF433 domain-containing protein [Nitrospira sp. NTP2]|nr:DUF433 domain-containing protein [Nitrospira sp. NTP2]RIK56439.1 MAG: hypothetical protein DCC63_17320 [Nitrospira sp.]
MAIALPLTDVPLLVPITWTERPILTGYSEPPSLGRLAGYSGICPMDDRIIIDPQICGGKPTIRGTHYGEEHSRHGGRWLYHGWDH